MGFLSLWFEKVVQAVNNQDDVVVFELKNTDSNKKKFLQTIEKENPKLVIFNGHGGNKYISGFNNEILVRCDDNEELLSGKIIHSMACKCASVLGPRCVSLGTKCFIGYKEDFHLWNNLGKTKAEQLADSTASLFLGPAYEAIIALIEGNTSGQAFERSQAKYKENLRILLTQNNPELITITASLFHNLKNQVCLGDNSAVF